MLFLMKMEGKLSLLKGGLWFSFSPDRAVRTRSELTRKKWHPWPLRRRRGRESWPCCCSKPRLNTSREVSASTHRVCLCHCSVFIHCMCSRIPLFWSRTLVSVAQSSASAQSCLSAFKCSRCRFSSCCVVLRPYFIYCCFSWYLLFYMHILWFLFFTLQLFNCFYFTLSFICSCSLDINALKFFYNSLHYPFFLLLYRLIGG